jgi:diguanylate cyclase (GGDEF)-like protein
MLYDEYQLEPRALKNKILPTPSAWRKFILQMGKATCVIAVTLVSVFFSMVVTIALAQLLHRQLEVVGFIAAILVPLTLGSLFGYYLFTLFFELDATNTENARLQIVDELTRAYNRHYFLELAGREFDRARRQVQPLSIIFFDIDDFHLVNDQYGRECGDAVLRHIASICLEGLRKHDIFARYGGEEFIILLSGTSGASVMRASERIRQLIAAQPLENDGRKVQITVSAGVTTLKDEDTDFDTFLQRAGQALSEAKSGGKNCSVAL